ncbi:MAG: hypothetical protein ACHREM_07420 [Polyangiales bacterium]
MPKHTLRRVAATASFVVLASVSTCPARADPSQVSFAALIGRPIDDNGPSMGFGLRGGVKLAGTAAPYFGARVLRFSDSTDLTVASTVTTYDLTVEAGYEWTFGPLAVRPQLALGIEDVTVSTPYFSGRSVDSAILVPGVVVTCEVSHPLFVGLEIDYTKLFQDVTDSHYLSVYLEAGAKF